MKKKERNYQIQFQKREKCKVASLPIKYLEAKFQKSKCLGSNLANMEKMTSYMEEHLFIQMWETHQEKHSIKFANVPHFPLSYSN